MDVNILLGTRLHLYAFFVWRGVAKQPSEITTKILYNTIPLSPECDGGFLFYE